MAFLTRRLLLGFVFLVTACGSGGSGSGSAGSTAGRVELLLRWRAASEAAGYVIHWGSASGTYTHALDVGDLSPDEDGVVSFVLEDVASTGTIYVALTSYDADASTSGFSNELSAIVP